jgi:putative transcriptional regulator
MPLKVTRKNTAKTTVAGEDASNLTGRLLLAMPGMADPRFQKAVIFICAHDKNGAMGLVINHVLPGIDMRELLKQLNIKPPGENTPAVPSKDADVMNGGPVETARGFLLHSSEFTQDDTIHLDGRFSVTGTVDALKAIADGNGPRDMLFILGYSGWGAGQLDRELHENTWLVADPDPGLVFETAHDLKWDRAVRAIGVDPAMLSTDLGHA